MKTRFTVLIICFCATLFSCMTTANVKTTPEYDGVDPKAQKYVDEYIDLAKAHGITFHSKVTVGFSKITKDYVIGYCTLGILFREIDFDKKNWAFSDDLERKVLAFHELTHCYCHRLHDYSADRAYEEENALKHLIRTVNFVIPMSREGFFDDGCAISIMHPIIINNRCSKAHYQHYIDEMFNRCQPY